jgi:hypothetical protein
MSQKRSEFTVLNGLCGSPARKGEQKLGGRGEIRTHDTLAGMPVFKTGALNRSATLPLRRFNDIMDVARQGGHAGAADWYSMLMPVQIDHKN